MAGSVNKVILVGNLVLTLTCVALKMGAPS